MTLFSSKSLEDVHLPYASLKTEEEREEFYADGLHLTAKGYDRIAELVFEVLDLEIKS
jgi:lysophospholipase L1-like esterase